MPKVRPPTSGYARLAQTEEEHYLEDEDHDDPNRGLTTVSTPGRQYAPIQASRRTDRMQASSRNSPSRRKRERRNSGVDIKAINARLERWADEIASKFKIKRGAGRLTENEQLEIQHSVFQAPDWIRPANSDTLDTQHADPPGLRMSKEEFDDIAESVRVAIENGVHPKLISQGSSGSYFATNSQGNVLGVFKPKDEEPYASKNPKWTKWIHRNLFPFFFGRACLIPNLSYVSEAAAYVLDTQLRCNIVPYTDIVSFSSKSFSYDFWDRRAFYRKKKPLPEKQGSLQVFLKGYKDATQFLKEHPWPDQQNSSLPADGARKKKKRRWAEECRPGGSISDNEDDDEAPTTLEEADRRRVFWTDGLQQSLREQLEKLVILDYIMRNTDRGLDNWMIRIDQQEKEAKIVVDMPSNGHVRSSEEPYMRPPEHMVASSRSGTPLQKKEQEGVVRLGAIDNSLSWPWKHPDAWRSYPFGWLFLPVSLIGQPFSDSTRKHFLPLLTSKQWWADTQLALRKCFKQDADFQEKMFAKQMAIIKGQAWNVVETLKTPDHGPLELTRRARVCVWDDLVDVPVAVPLRASTEIRRPTSLELHPEEMDISAAGPSGTDQTADLLNIGSSPPKQIPNRFNLSRQSSEVDVRDETERASGTLSPPNVRAMNDDYSDIIEEQRSLRPNHRSRMSFDDSRNLRYPASTRHARRLSHTGRLHGTFVDDVEGDLGYAAAEGREGNRKRVIVERLETVKSKNPVFTWC